jgi:uncharacterized protein (TIGR02588 family)
VNRATTSLLELAIGALGCVMLASVCGWLAYDALILSHSPPDIVAEATSVHRMQRGWLVMVRARNDGGTPVADAVIEVRARSADGTIEAASVRFEQLAAGSEEEGGVNFEREPMPGSIVLVPLSLTLP